MINESDMKEVYFNEYCKTCKYEKLDEAYAPCCECLEEPVRLYSHKPEKWKSRNE